MNTQLIVCLVVSILLLYYVWSVELQDIKCSEVNKESFDGNGKYYVAGKWEKNDNISTMLNKIVFLSNVDDRVVKWRRCVIGSVLCTILISLLIIPVFNAKIYVLICLIIFIVFYMIYSYYKFHFDIFPSNYIKENIQGIKNKLNIIDTEKNPTDIKKSVSIISGITLPERRMYKKI